jgi:hypothetical protein
LNRLCEKTGATVFAISHWRPYFEPGELKAKYIAEGIEEKFFHDDLHAHATGEPKSFDIDRWLQKNRANPAPDRNAAPPAWFDPKEPGKYPDRQSWEKARSAHWKAYEDHGVDFLLLDDDPSDVGNRDRHLHVDYYRGFDHEAYRVAAGFFGVEDREFGVYPVSSEDLDLAVRAHSGRRMAALSFLHSSLRMAMYFDVRTNARGLDEGRFDPHPVVYGDYEKSMERYAERIRDELRLMVGRARGKRVREIIKSEKQIAAITLEEREMLRLEFPD